MKNIKEIEKYLSKNNITNLIILCRGKSIEKFINFSNEDANNNCIFFVNRFSELLKNKDIVESIKNNSKNENVQYINNDHVNIENESSLNAFNVKLVQSNKKKSDHDAPRLLMSLEKVQSYPQIFYIDESSKDEDYKLKSNGMSCLGYLSTIDFIRNIYIFGLDFFECDYFSHHVHTGEKSVREYQPAKGKIAKEQLQKLVIKNRHINYHLYTYANFNGINIDNFYTY